MPCSPDQLPDDPESSVDRKLVRVLLGGLTPVLSLERFPLNLATTNIAMITNQRQDSTTSQAKNAMGDIREDSPSWSTLAAD